MYKHENALPIQSAEHPAIFAHDSDQIPRFVLPTDEAIVSDYHFVQGRLAEAMAADPAIVGGLVFGSTTKGQEDPRDLDLTVLVDADRLGLQLRPNLSSPMVSFSNWSGFEGAERMDGPERRYREVMWQLFGSPNSSEERLTNLPIQAEAFPISHTFLHKLAEFETGNAERLARYQELRQTGDQLTEIDRLADWATIPTDEETLRSITGLAELMSDAEKTHGIDVMSVRTFLGRLAEEEGTEYAHLRLLAFSQMRLASSLPMRLFNLALTPGLAPYRRTFLEGLAEAPNPELAYSYFIHRLKTFEDSTKRPRDTSKIPYPATLTEALEVYS